MFDSTDATKRALRSIAGRQFGGRTVLCAYAGKSALVGAHKFSAYNCCLLDEVVLLS